VNWSRAIKDAFILLRKTDLYPWFAGRRPWATDVNVARNCVPRFPITFYEGHLIRE
jgi:hypothetical protein